MATSRPIRKSEWLTYLTGHHIGGNRAAGGDEHPPDFVLQSDFGLDVLNGNEYRSQVCMRVFGLQPSATDASLAAAITNGTAPGLYVREGDDTSDWEVYREVLARRVEEAMAARRDGEGGVGADETTTAAGAQTTPAARALPTATTRQDDEIRVGDVVEVVSCRNIDWTTPVDVGGRGRVSGIDKDMGFVRLDTQPREWIAAIVDVRKVSSPSPQTVAANASPMPDEEVARIEAAVADEMRRSLSSPLASSSDETTRQRVVNPVPPTTGVYIGPATIRFDDRAFTGIITATGPLRHGGAAPVSSSTTASSPPTAASPPSPPSRFSLLEVDADASSSPPQAPKPSTGLASLQQELRAEREAKRALAAAQTPPGRFDLLECDLPAVPVAAAPVAAVAVKASSRPVASSPPKPHNPVETITDLTAARSPLELARMLEGLNDELSTMMRQREAN